MHAGSSHKHEHIFCVSVAPSAITQFQIALHCSFEASFCLFLAQSASFKAPPAFKRMKGSMKVNYFQKNKTEKQY